MKSIRNLKPEERSEYMSTLYEAIITCKTVLYCSLLCLYIQSFNEKKFMSNLTRFIMPSHYKTQKSFGRGKTILNGSGTICCYAISDKPLVKIYLSKIKSRVLSLVI